MILACATEIFAKNGILGLKFNFVDVKEGKKHKETYEYQMFLAIIKVKTIEGITTDPGNSFIQPNGRIGVYDEDRISSFPHNGFSSWVNLDNPDIAQHKGDKNYAAGYVVAHELLHQLVGIAAFYLTGDSRRYNFHRSEGRMHLNSNGHETVIPARSNDELRPAEEILPFHMNILKFFK